MSETPQSTDRLSFAVGLEMRGELDQAISAYEGNLLAALHIEINIFEYINTVNALADTLQLQNNFAAGTFGFKNDIGIAPRRDRQIFNGQLLQQFLT